MTIRKQLWLMFVPAMLLAMFWGERPLAKSQNMQNNQTTKVASTTSGPVPIPRPRHWLINGKRRRGKFR